MSSPSMISIVRKLLDHYQGKGYTIHRISLGAKAYDRLAEECEKLTVEGERKPGRVIFFFDGILCQYDPAFEADQIKLENQ